MGKTLERRGGSAGFQTLRWGWAGREDRVSHHRAHALLSPTSMGAGTHPVSHRPIGQQAAWVPAGLSSGLSDQAAWKPVLMGPGGQGPQLLAPWLSPGWTLVPEAQAAEEVLSSGAGPRGPRLWSWFLLPLLLGWDSSGGGEGSWLGHSRSWCSPEAPRASLCALHSFYKLSGRDPWDEQEGRCVLSGGTRGFVSSLGDGEEETLRDGPFSLTGWANPHCSDGEN